MTHLDIRHGLGHVLTACQQLQSTPDILTLVRIPLVDLIQLCRYQLRSTGFRLVPHRPVQARMILLQTLPKVLISQVIDLRTRENVFGIQVWTRYGFPQVSETSRGVELKWG